MPTIKNGNYQIIDVCSNEADAGCLKKYYEDNKCDDYCIISIRMGLAIGDIKTNHLDIVRELYNDPNYTYQDDLDSLINSINKDIKIRIWSSKMDSNSYLLLLYLTSLLSSYDNQISVIFTTDYNLDAITLGCCCDREVNELLKYEKVLSINELHDYQKTWEDVVNVNSEIRILENNTIVNKNYADYDDLILNKLSQIGECKVYELVAKLLLDNSLNMYDDFIDSFLVKRLINHHKIVIVQADERFYHNIIKKD
ncbi:MAG: DUF1835 domain-containing protein [Bacilli bacterium]|nr:DUF1835 domain-containing protein [Bacilli bacterium]